MSMGQIKDILLPHLEQQLRAYSTIGKSEEVIDIVFGYKDMEAPLPLIIKLKPKEVRTRR